MADVIYGLGARKMPEESMEGVLLVPTESAGSSAMEIAYSKTNPERSIGIGCCGGMQTYMAKGELVVVTEAVDGGNFAEFSKTELTDWLDQREEFSFKTDKELTNQLKKTLDGRDIAYHEGKIFSVSSRMVETPQFIKELTDRGYSGVEMETATLLACAQYNNKKAASLQVISDIFSKPFDPEVANKMWRPALDVAINSLNNHDWRDLDDN